LKHNLDFPRIWLF